VVARPTRGGDVDEVREAEIPSFLLFGAGFGVVALGARRRRKSV
jgi:hypothetical protein